LIPGRRFLVFQSGACIQLNSVLVECCETLAVCYLERQGTTVAFFEGADLVRIGDQVNSFCKQERNSVAKAQSGKQHKML
jgi:hypothetical protein